ncbi:tumor necrosis factor receptor superfamily member 14-like [Neoarius graeffei]|uniref:tumor necrosis factor receptor superfamily member 14-like n=1 Tax=Neoarius graeffei TaxID=443677 RepID=UPI00298CD04E|nr:tumor necrosis factor receptor superfamily member 14-like [Neoarius graeffei]
MKSTFLTLRLYILGVSAVLVSGTSCRSSEYLSAAGECCSLCDRGFAVRKDCSGDYNTRCKPCLKGEFMNIPSGFHKCLPCKTCDAGLSILQACTTVMNTVCEVLDGYYCLRYLDGECCLAVKHSGCKPGQQIKTLGTKDSDTVCEPCPLGFYSPEGVNCTKWTDCSVRNEVEDQEGTSIRDVQCKPTRERYGLIPAFVLYLPTIIVLFLKHKMNCTVAQDQKEENEEVDQPAAR